MARRLVLMTAHKLAEPGVRALEAAGLQLRLLTSWDEAAELAAILASETVVAVISRTLPITAAHIASCPTLQIISRHGVGYNNVDITAATARGIPVTIADGANAQSVAELAIALMLAAARRVPQQDAGIRAGGWDRSGGGRQLAGRRLGLVACGAIGRAVARMAQGIGMEVWAYDPKAETPPGVNSAENLDALLAVADVLSLHAPLTPATRGMIGADELARLPRDAIVVNTARGGLVDEAALAAAIASGHIAGAGLDTLEVEPPPTGHPLLAEPRAVLTPHVGGSTDAALDAVAHSAAQNVVDFLGGRGLDPRLVVNPGVLRATIAEA
jgi:D-3-phosphoglycerate dehydrogenase